jgi:hypothetical protein
VKLRRLLGRYENQKGAVTSKRAAVKEWNQEGTATAMSIAMQQPMLPLLLAMDVTKKGLLGSCRDGDGRALGSARVDDA